MSQNGYRVCNDQNTTSGLEDSSIFLLILFGVIRNRVTPDTMVSTIYLLLYVTKKKLIKEGGGDQFANSYMFYPIPKLFATWNTILRKRLADIE